MALRLIDKYIFRRTLLTFFAAVMVLAALYIVIDLISDKLDNIAENNVPWTVVGEFYVCFLPRILIQSIPVALLVSTLFVLGEMVRRRELVALRAAGLSLQRITGVVIVVGCLVAVGTFFVSDSIAPWLGSRANYIKENIIDPVREGRHHPIFYVDPDRGRTLWIARFYPRSARGEQVSIIEYLPDRSVSVVQADEIRWISESSQWILSNVVECRKVSEETFPVCGDPVEEAAAHIGVDPGQLEDPVLPTDEMTRREISEEIHRRHTKGHPAPNLEVARHMRFALPAVNLIVPFLAIPFAVRQRRGGLILSFGLSIVLTLVFLGLIAGSSGLGRIGVIPPWLGAWGPNALFLAGGIWFFSKAHR